MNAAGVKSWQTTLFLWRDMWKLGSGNKVKIPLSGILQAAAFPQDGPNGEKSRVQGGTALEGFMAGAAEYRALIFIYFYHLSYPSDIYRVITPLSSCLSLVSST